VSGSRQMRADHRQPPRGAPPPRRGGHRGAAPRALPLVLPQGCRRHQPLVVEGGRDQARGERQPARPRPRGDRERAAVEQIHEVGVVAKIAVEPYRVALDRGAGTSCRSSAARARPCPPLRSAWRRGPPAGTCRRRRPPRSSAEARLHDGPHHRVDVLRMRVERNGPSAARALGHPGPRRAGPPAARDGARSIVRGAAQRSAARARARRARARRLVPKNSELAPRAPEANPRQRRRGRTGSRE